MATPRHWVEQPWLLDEAEEMWDTADPATVWYWIESHLQPHENPFHYWEQLRDQAEFYVPAFPEGRDNAYRNWYRDPVRNVDGSQRDILTSEFDSGWEELNTASPGQDLDVPIQGGSGLPLAPGGGGSPATPPSQDELFGDGTQSRVHGGSPPEDPIDNEPSWYIEPPTTIPDEITPGDYYQQLTYNRALPYLDAITQESTAEWLARDNPIQYNDYAYVNQGEQDPLTQRDLQQRLTPNRLTQIAENLSYEALRDNLPGEVQEDLQLQENNEQRMNLQSGLRWMTEALNTGASAAGPVDETTRSQRRQASQHLETLMNEAAQEPERGGRYSTLVENILNPVVDRNSLSGALGNRRALRLQSGDFRRGGISYRNTGAL